MKKILMLLTTVSLFSLASCSADEVAPKSKTSAEHPPKEGSNGN